MTQHSKLELDNLFADNTSGLITPARLRDLVESCTPSTAAMHYHSPGTATPIATAATFVKAANTSHLHASNRFAMPSNNRLVYSGPAASVAALVTATLAFKCAADNQVLAFAIAINGVVDAGSVIRTTIATGAAVQAVSVQAHATLQPTDYVEVWVANDTSDADVTIDHGNVFAIAYLA